MMIFVSNLEFHGFHGVSEAERSLGHPMRLDMVATVDEAAYQTDLISDTLDYGSLAAFAVEICTQEANHTLEFACERIGKRVLENYPSVKEIMVTLAKINPHLPHSIGAVGVQKRFEREFFITANPGV